MPEKILDIAFQKFDGDWEHRLQRSFAATRRNSMMYENTWPFLRPSDVYLA
jgi:hypothetical protein